MPDLDATRSSESLLAERPLESEPPFDQRPPYTTVMPVRCLQPGDCLATGARVLEVRPGPGKSVRIRTDDQDGWAVDHMDSTVRIVARTI